MFLIDDHVKFPSTGGLAVVPRKRSAVLFYSRHTDAHIDSDAWHYPCMLTYQTVTHIDIPLKVR